LSPPFAVPPVFSTNFSYEVFFLFQPATFTMSSRAIRFFFFFCPFQSYLVFLPVCPFCRLLFFFCSTIGFSPPPRRRCGRKSSPPFSGHDPPFRFPVEPLLWRFFSPSPPPWTLLRPLWPPTPLPWLLAPKRSPPFPRFRVSTLFIPISAVLAF